MSPTVTGMSVRFLRSCSAIEGDSSTPLTVTPTSASGMATRPVPMANSRAGPSPASRARKATAGPTTSGANMKADVSSYASAVCASHRSLLVTASRLPHHPIAHQPFCRRASSAELRREDFLRLDAQLLTFWVSVGGEHRREHLQPAEQAATLKQVGIERPRIRSNGLVRRRTRGEVPLQRPDAAVLEVEPEVALGRAQPV